MRRSLRKFGLALLVLTAMGSLLFANGKNEGSSASKMTRENTFKVAVWGKASDPSNFNIWNRSPSQQTNGLQQLIYESFWTTDYQKGEIIDTLASGPAEYNDDFTKMTVKLREGINWSDGETFNADDVVFTVETLKATKGMTYNGEFNIYVDKVYKTDDYTVVFELKESNSRFHDYFLDRWGACRFFPEHIWSEEDNPMAFKNYPPVGTGQYTVENYDQAGYWVILKKRADWDKTAVGQLEGEPAAEYVQMIAYDTLEKKILAITNNEVDTVSLDTDSFHAAIQKNDKIHGFATDFPYGETMHPCITGARFNTQMGEYQSKEVRWALNLCINMVDMTMNAYDGSAAVSAFFLPNLPLYYELYHGPLADWAENELTIDVNGKAFSPFDPDFSEKLAAKAKARGYNVPSSKEDIQYMFGYGWWKYAPEEASELLMAQGFTKDSKGMWLTPDGSPWKLTILCDTNSQGPPFKWAFALADQYRRFGIDCTAEAVQDAGTRASVGDFDIHTGWPIKEPFGSHADMYRSLDPYHSKYYVPIPEKNIGHESRWSDPELDVIIDEMKEMVYTDPALKDKVIEGFKIVIEEQPGLSLSTYPDFPAFNDTYWTGYPDMANPYSAPHWHWPNFRFVLPHLSSVE